MHDIASLAEQLLASAPRVPKVASAPADSPSAHEYANLLRKIAHAVRAEGLTVSEVDLDDILSGVAMLKIASDEESPAGAAISRSPIAAEARALATQLRKHAADVRRTRVAETQIELERAVVSAHQKLASADATATP